MSQDNSHSLVEIKPSEWKILLNLYATKRTESIGYHLINNYIKWLSRDPEYTAKCYALDGDWQSDGTFLMIANNGASMKEVFFNTLSENLDRVTKALLCLKPKSDEYLLAAYGERLKPAVDAFKKTFTHVGLDTNQTAWYYATKDIIATFTAEPPAGLELRKLHTRDAPTINEIWPHRSEGSVEFVKRLIVYNVSVGAYEADGKLVAWCLRLPTGALGVLQVLESHKRLGLGSLLVRYLSKQISELGDEVRAPVVTENTPSRKMFEKLGFQKIDYVYWTW